MHMSQQWPPRQWKLIRSLLIGGKKFSRDLQPKDKDGNPVSLWRVCSILPCTSHPDLPADPLISAIGPRR